jgi:hypothetical protein
MELTTYLDAATFLDRAQEPLERREPVNSLLLGVSLRMRDYPEYVEAPPYLATVDDGVRLVAAAMMTPPHQLVVASDQPDAERAFALLAADLHRHGWAPPGVNGPTALSSAFAAAWSAATGEGYAVKMQLRTFALRTVIQPPLPLGHLRVATEDDLDLLARWLGAFGQEALATDETTERNRTVAERGIRHGNYFLWDDGGPVALAAKTRPTRHGITVGPVYTPPEERNKGYATALVAALSQQLLDHGTHFCTLFTDRANPTSNSIYQKIGYQPVCDFTEYQFLPP